jgi:very-short-patch-repair endonuclease
MAAVLACGPGAALSHGSAAQLWGLPGRESQRVDVTVPGTGGRKRRRLVVIHRAQLRPSEVTVHDGIPVTSPGRTVVDLADYGDRRLVERAIDEAEYLRLDLSDVEVRQGRRGSGVLAAVLTRHEVGSTRTRSELEERMLALCREQGLPQPAVNALVEGYEVDFVWRAQRVVVETDGHSAHGTREAFERDRVRDADLTTAGWRVVRVTYRRLHAQPMAITAQLRALL